MSDPCIKLLERLVAIDSVNPSLAPGAAGEMMNLAGGGRTSLLDLLRTIGEIVGRPLEPVFGPPREGDVRDSQADPAKAVRLLGFTPEISLTDGLTQTIAWFRTTTVR